MQTAVNLLLCENFIPWRFALKKKDEQLSGRMALRAAIVNPGVIAALVVCGYLFVNTLLSAVIA